MRRVAGALALSTLLSVPAQVPAQVPARAPGTLVVGLPAAEGRVDLIAGRATTLHAGAALLWPVGRNVRVGVLASAGITRGPRDTDAGALRGGDRRRRASGRGELVARFVLEPGDPRRWRLYGSAGVGVLVVRGSTGTVRAFVAGGIEGRPWRMVRPALELGLGGGVRVGVVLRQTDRGAR